MITIIMLLIILQKVNHTLNDDLQIDLSPVQKVLNSELGQSTSIQITIGNKNFDSCSTYCDVSVFDTHTNKILYEDNFTLFSNSKQKLNYDLPPPDKTGQKIFYFEATCNNLQSIICQTDSKQKYRSSLITVNYKFSDEQIKNNKFIKDNLIKASKNINSAINQEQFIFNQIEEIKKHTNTIQYPPASSESYLDILNLAIINYENQEFSNAKDNLQKIPELNKEDMVEKLIAAIQEYNKKIEVLNSLNFNEINLAYEFYQKINSYKSNLIKEEYEKLPRDSFEILLNTDATAILLTFESYTKNVTEEKEEYEKNLLDVANAYQELFKSNLESTNMCDELLYTNELIRVHNSNLTEKKEEHLYAYSLIENNAPNFIFNETNVFSDEFSFWIPEGETFNSLFSASTLTEINESYCTQNISELVYYKPFEKILILNISESNEMFTAHLIKEFCCINNICDECITKPIKNPVLFVHGHSFNKNDAPEKSISAFAKIQKKLSDEGLFINGGDIDYQTSDSGLWSKMSIPIAIRGTYYYLPYIEEGLIQLIVKKEEGIDSYSLRLKELIDISLQNTGAKKVTIVAHSMGGLVSRNYLKLFGEDKVDKLIMIATPNNGITGRIEDFCAYFGDPKACFEMAQNSVFMKRLNDYKLKLPVATIIGKGCDTDGIDGDGVVSVDSSFVEYADTNFIEGKCKDIFGTEMHSDLLDPEKYPEVYEVLKDILLK